ncbi:MAG: hypothetical protein A3E78_12050 [Alphaproteobacteria bacterium RIFCSPHIGHO2_12_FULL_63_12]|nr:MAG: hypothetical protein A3E78_12050 [Alphaproteobacteria bacterium RIFCSPHIGHO2_12_FULL_63_12]
MPAAKGTRIERRHNGVFYIVWTGNTRGRSTGTRDRALAEAALAEFIVERGHTDGVGGLTVAGALDYYRTEHVFATRPDGTFVVASRDPLYYVRKDGVPAGTIPTLAAHFGTTLVRDVTDDQVAEYVAQRTSGRLGRKVGAGTLRKELGCLIAAMNHSANKNLKPRRIAKADIPTIALPEAPPPKDRWLSRAEADALLAAAQSEGAERLTRATRFIAVALGTAARRRSIETLTWFQVDLDRGIVHFNPPGRRQTKKRRVPVPISDALRPVLERARAERTSEFVLDHDGAIRKTFETAIAAAGLKGVTPHTLRHTWATWAAQAGIAMWDIAGVLGDDEATVRKNYLHHAPDHLRSAVNFWRDRTTGAMNLSKVDET